MSSVRRFNRSTLGAGAMVAVSFIGLYLARTSSQQHAEEMFIFYLVTAVIGFFSLVVFWND